MRHTRLRLPAGTDDIQPLDENRRHVRTRESVIRETTWTPRHAMLHARRAAEGRNLMPKLRQRTLKSDLGHSRAELPVHDLEDLAVGRTQFEINQLLIVPPTAFHPLEVVASLHIL